MQENNILKESFLDVDVSKDLEENLKYVSEIFDKCDDLIIRRINIGGNPAYGAAIIYINGMPEEEYIEQSVIQRLIDAFIDNEDENNINIIPQRLLGLNEGNILKNLTKVFDAIVNGDTVLIIDGVDHVLDIFTQDPPTRAIEEPQTETVIRGPREGFTEAIDINVTLIRKKIMNPNLKVENMRIGTQTRSKVKIIYLSNIANPKIVEEVKNRLSRIELDSGLDSTYISEYIQDPTPYSIVPTTYKTEKPDKAASKILEGRVLIFADGSPIALIVPCVFIEFLHSSEDYYSNAVFATVSRFIRAGAFIVAILLPAFWVSIVTYHIELIPTSLVVSVIKARSGVPFSSLWETFFMMLIFEVLREAGIRMPRTVGQTISVVGAVIIGQAAVQAGLVSVPVIIIVSVTTLSSYTIPSPEMIDMTLLPRFILLFMGGYFGLVGVLSLMIIFLTYMVSLRSFGVPFMGGYAPIAGDTLQDSLVRMPLETMKKRPRLFTWRDSIRRKSRRKKY